MTKETAAARFRQAAALLPPALRRAAEELDAVHQSQAEELRLRVGWPPTILYPEGELPLGQASEPVTPELLRLILEVATRASVHAALERIRNGFFTVQGGHRIGLCGAAVVRQGQVCSLSHLSSLSIRIAKEVVGASREVMDKLWSEDGLESTLILSQPGCGKTTLLRDLIRAVSEGEGCPALRVGVADERGELAGLWQGVPQLAVGRHTDVMDGCPKEVGLLSLLRGMNPQVLAADEITAPEDCAALVTAANCGVTLLCTAHGARPEDLAARPIYQSLLQNRIFRKLVLITREKDGTRRYQVNGL